MAEEKNVINNNRGIITEGQRGNNYIINIGRQRLEYDDQVAQRLLAKIPKSEPITFQAVGSMADQGIGKQYAAFLQANGVKISEMRLIGMLAPPPSEQVNWDADRRIVTIAPSSF